MNTAQFVLDMAETKPQQVQETLVSLHQKGETVADILEFVQELQSRMKKVQYSGKKVFDVCGTGGSGKNRINLSTALAIKLSQGQPTEVLKARSSRKGLSAEEKRTDSVRVRGTMNSDAEIRSLKGFCIAKHGNKAASGKVGSFDLIDAAGYAIGDTPKIIATQLQKQNLSFIFAPSFHPALKPLAPIRQQIPHPTIFNYLGPILNPVANLTAQMTGVSSIEIGEKLAEVCVHLGKNILLVHDTAFGLDDVSIGGATKFWMVGLDGKNIHTGTFFPEDYGFERVPNFSEIQGGGLDTNKSIFEALLNNTAPKPHQNFLNINKVVAEEFFIRF